MVKAYILIEMAAGHSVNLVRKLRGQEGVRDIHRVTGPYDVIAVVEAPDLNKVNDFVTGTIHHMDGVMRTTTCVSLGNQ